MGSKVISLRFGTPYALKGEVVIRSLVYVDASKGEKAIDKIKKAVEAMYEDKLFVKHAYTLVEAETIWEESN
jgi:hypothetical protein